MEPTRPIMEEKAKRVCRWLVGYSSAVYTYNVVATIAMDNLPIRNIVSDSPKRPVNI